MIRFRRISSLTMLIALVQCVFCNLSIAQYWENGYALLTNDSVMVGRIEQQGEAFRIKVNEGNEVRLPRNQVVAIGNSLSELYQFKKRSLPQFARGGDHAQLARWCLKVNLLTEAGEHYLIQAQSNPPKSNPSVKQLGEEIKDRMLQQNDFRIAMGYPPIQRNVPIVDSLAQNSAVVQASTASNPGGAIPPRAQAKFAEQVQHILVNRCGQAACHGHATTTSFRLLEVGGRDASAQTQANLDSVLRYINNDPQAKSLLIEYMTKSHGSMRSPAIGARESHLVQEVAGWVQFVQNPVVSAEALSQPSVLNPLAPGAPQLRQVPHSGSAPGSNTLRTSDFPEGLDLPTADELDALDTQVRREAQAPMVQLPPNNASNSSTLEASSDPFDASEFNRQASDRR